jgi:hypothetical protein
MRPRESRVVLLALLVRGNSRHGLADHEYVDIVRPSYVYTLLEIAHVAAATGISSVMPLAPMDLPGEAAHTSGDLDVVHLAERDLWRLIVPASFSRPAGAPAADPS